jgi:DNA-binding transcriptional ArsR family regulator
MKVQEVFQALADPTRREILALLRAGRLSAGEIADKFDITKPSMSHHLSVLKNADLVRSERAGQQLIYSLNTSVVEEMGTVIFNLLSVQKEKRK